MSLFEQILQTNLINFIIVVLTLAWIFKKAKLGALIEKMAQDVKGRVEKSSADAQSAISEYKATKGTYYVKVSRDETAGKNDELNYALQMNVGGKYKHDYVMTESVSDDTKNKQYSKVPATTDYTVGGTLSSVNALQIQATRYQATAQMLQIGYLNMADIYNRNSKF